MDANDNLTARFKVTCTAQGEVTQIQDLASEQYLNRGTGGFEFSSGPYGSRFDIGGLIIWSNNNALQVDDEISAGFTVVSVDEYGSPTEIQCTQTVESQSAFTTEDFDELAPAPPGQRPSRVRLRQSTTAVVD